MASQTSSDEPLYELKHDPVAGYGKAFAIAFAIMTLYLAAILISSPGSVKDKHGDHGDHDKASSH